jgi:putative endonuclease
VYYEVAETAMAAIEREKQLKAGSRQDKIKLIKAMNSKWLDLYEKIL